MTGVDTTTTATATATATKTKTEVWAKVELMGHQTLAGRISEEQHFGVTMGRLDVPIGHGPIEFRTVLFSGSSVYKITHVDETTARAIAWNHPAQTIDPYDLRFYQDSLALPESPRRSTQEARFAIADTTDDADGEHRKAFDEADPLPRVGVAFDEADSFVGNRTLDDDDDDEVEF